MTRDRIAMMITFIVAAVGASLLVYITLTDPPLPPSLGGTHLDWLSPR